ncbi:hypothetical protein PHYBLDRAFT_176051 [Phycomyces blakesleeanus NRRL 1555(-)]|uniref:Uncharacterized protein n=1 Tax=Phycomyces blakesleeanus (strain ATCC 8743b / DSM 1359 / FGSC 10004 / NBRC 33097 / NRRL 1555) TaxID=763407 RepID=A0A162T1B3_PHYB8|nr:hypothetical protein PHYBLDRAFT_176051 [Phycomyces blakesleeanus NRRL 1555(-)]OAD65452.1 hypothetical protein PHYBLDRAFT_176051 [Phycomyces blakesleeanus NRRL 1555(-)]|eukprot:XP_018283492.1 hypothetical protein PHYBLDRAFT_176051 [Phycomyces blakesleeanus NRRL 1555(-)]
MTIEVILGVSPETIRYLIARGIDANGQSIIVEIDESKFEKKKYHRGHQVEGVWVLGVPHRDATTLLQVIKKFSNNRPWIVGIWSGHLIQTFDIGSLFCILGFGFLILGTAILL